MAGEIDQGIKTAEWLVIWSTLAGPILAVQAQKWIEAARAKHAVKDRIFQTLMATRAARLSAEHVQALNMISIAFYGTNFFRFRWQTSKEKAVYRAWRDYFDVLDVNDPSLNESQIVRIVEAREDKFYALLGAIAIEQNYDFDPVDLRRQMYSPVAHGRIEQENEVIRTGLARVLNRQQAIPMEVINLPSSGNTGGQTAQGQSPRK
ncbi:DUF6680 family protein [Noviherbaspirillum galbum]|uniref:DUF6680 domain-containing protein n=1 Tax=Noviherbaspirillum galbum TaxID=2709383 RepID=A0A6B3SLP1_9BURK|nr:DUF6680 family protein [Noviherbaspirillum galbum]NEX61721.1 hypothetical protein [Noviherbaspirillum galbum]